MFTGERLRMLRKEKEITLVEVAHSIEVQPRTITFYETNQRRPSAEKVYALAEFFDVSLDYLFGRTECRTVKRE